MFSRAFALLAVLAVTPAHATLIEYAFTANLTGRFSSLSTFREFGLNPDRTYDVTGGLLFDDAAPRISYEETAFGSTSAYDVSNMRLWVNVGDYVLTGTGGGVFIHDDRADLCGPYCRKDTWALGVLGDGDEVNGHTVSDMGFNVLQYGGRLLTSSELQVPGMAEFSPWLDTPSFHIYFAGDGHLGGYLRSIEPTTTSVPEPGTLSLLAVGVVGAWAGRKRRHVAANA